MANRKLHLRIRKMHRYLGLILGIQFLFWTISGLYFSWTNIDEIHGDFQHKHPPTLKADFHLISPDSILQKLKPDFINSFQIVSILQQPFYSINYSKAKETKLILANAQTGAIRMPVAKDEAVNIAAESFNSEPKLVSAEYITSANAHHEYRGKPLPAWAVTFDHPSNTTVYVSAERGMVETFRNNKWRLFDFLWMGHVMGYQERDNINNWLLRFFSLFGLITVISGFALFFVSNRFFKRNKIYQ